ncbi:MAG: CDP-glucose 4,6-dehydratase [Elusimicrobiota bacterium]|jgi:CDP-glucose 4,6-dehydratase|nr:CDP-glucose 4,6-dehydratase [Elusimicrobiota bacterium]
MQDFYKGKKVFITGHTGFKGAWLTQVLLSFGAEVKGYALAPNTEPSLYNLLNLKDKMQSVIADIRDGEKLKAEMTAFKPDIALHLAAQPLVRLSYAEPVMTYETNIMGLVHFLEAVRQTPSARSVVNITSDKCYENRETNTPYKETDPMGGFDPYSSSKGMAELLSASYRNSFFNPKDYGVKHKVALATCRAGNVIGGGDYALDRIAPDCARAISQGKEIVLRSPNATRPWQHVLEPLFGYLLVAKKLWDSVDYAQGWNFGPEPSDIKTVEELVKKFIAVWGKGSYSITPDTKLHEAKLLHLDITKAKTLLNWRPVYNFDKAVLTTAEWYKNFYEGKDIVAYTMKQIKDYSQDYAKLN